ncbi:hypothetical protein J3459_011506 [Metarhizium acridum]|nr:hypothetical protein J3459_011506 [Metarhizium acridum]
MPFSKKWEITAELDLCMAIIFTGGSAGSYKWPEIHELMVKFGHDFTKDAISYVFPHPPLIPPASVLYTWSHPCSHETCHQLTRTSQHFTKSILKGFKDRHGLPSGKLESMTPTKTKRKAAGDAEESPSKRKAK